MTLKTQQRRREAIRTKAINDFVAALSGWKLPVVGIVAIRIISGTIVIRRRGWLRRIVTPSH
jgi:hypothetical protein